MNQAIKHAPTHFSPAASLAALRVKLSQYSQGYAHDSQAGFQLLDVDRSGMPYGPKAASTEQALAMPGRPGSQGAAPAAVLAAYVTDLATNVAAASKRP